jgi:hypothetical protein
MPADRSPEQPSGDAPEGRSADNLATEGRALDRRALDRRAFDRRAMVRRSAAVLAGTAGILAAPALMATAAAEPGDTLRLGGRNRAGDAQTRLQSTTTVASLSVLNERVRSSEPDGDVDLVAAQLRLESPVPGAVRPQVPDVQTMAAGDIAAAGGLLYFGAESGNFDVVASQVFTSYFANYLHPVPARNATVLDTRVLTVPDRALFTAGDLTADGRLVAGHRVAVDLRVLVNTAAVPPQAAVALSLQIFGAAETGVLTVYADQSAAAGVDVMAYAVLPGKVTADGAPFALPASGAAIVGLDADDRLWLSISRTAHVVVRVTGLFVPDPTAIVDTAETLLETSPYARRVQRQRRALRRLIADNALPK